MTKLELLDKVKTSAKSFGLSLVPNMTKKRIIVAVIVAVLTGLGISLPVEQVAVLADIVLSVLG